MINQQHEENYTWIPARISPEVYSQIDSVAKSHGLRRYQVISAAVKAGLWL